MDFHSRGFAILRVVGGVSFCFGFGFVGDAVVVAIVLGVVNAVLRPILILLTLPITILTLGLGGLTGWGV